jgi:hypothetical protein
MAVQHGDKSQGQPAGAQGQASQPGAAQSQAQQSYTPPQAQPARPGLPINERFQRSGNVTGSDARSAEALSTFVEAGKQAVAQQILTSDYNVYRFDRHTHEVGMSAILICKTAKDAKGNAVIVIRPLILENDNDRIKPRQVPIQGANGMITETLDVKPTPRDIFTAQYWSRIAAYVRSQQSMENAVVHCAGALGVYGEFDVKSVEACTRLLLTSVNRCDDILMRLDGEAPFSVATDLKADNEVLVVKMDFTGRPVEDSLGNPIRSDIIVSLNRSDKASKAQANEYYDSDTQLNQVSLAVSLEYAPVQAQQVYGQPPVQAAPFTPTITITDVRPAPWVKAFTMEMHIFATGNAYRATYGQAWARALLPQVGVKNDPKDIGALGYMIEPSKAMIDTKSDTFTDAHFAELMHLMVKPNPIFLIDLNRVGDNAAIDSIYLDAMSAGPNKMRAKQALVRACINLYGQCFTKYFNVDTDEILFPYGSEVGTGYYIDGKGEKADRRDLDVLAGLNLSKGNQAEFMSFYATMADLRIHPEVRFKQRENFESLFLGNTVVRTGRVDRAVYNPKWIEAMDKSAAEAGLNVAIENMHNVFGGQRFTGNTSIMQYAVTGVANMGGMQQAGGFASPIMGSTGIIYQ